MEKVLKLYKYIDGVNDTPFPNEEEQLIVRDFRYDAKRMGGAPTITFNAMHRLCLDNLWGKEVYATFNGERYYIKQTPTSSYSNSDTRYKHDVELVSERAVLDNIYFYDVVTGNNGVDKPVSNSSKFTFFGDIEEYANRLNYSLKWSNVDYSIVIDEGVTSEEKQVTFEDQVVTNALQEIYNIYQIPYYFVGKVIHVGEYQNNVDHVFKYGATNSLLSISKNNSNAKIVNRITGVGSQDNIPYYYPNDDEKGVTRPLLNGSSRGVSISNQSRYRKVRLSDTFVFHNTIQTQTPLIDSSIYTLGDLTFDKKEEGKDAQYSVDFYYTFSLKDGGNVLFNVSTDDENTVDLRYEIYKTSGNHLGFFKGENTISLTGGESSSYNFIIRWTFLNPNVLFGVEEQLESLISSKLNIAAYIVVDEEKTWTLKNIPISLDSYGLKVDNPSDGDVITIQQVSYINPQPFLMPPIYREEEGRKRFYNAKNNEYENVEGGGYYVFENEYSKNRPSEHIENFDDIKPTIKNVTNSFGQRIDSFVDFAYDLNDNDEVDEEGKFIHKYFFAKLRRFDGENGFNLFDHAIDESEMIISMTSGSCGSCSFKVMVNKDNHKNTVQVDANGNLLRDSNGNVRFGSPQDRQNDTENYEVWIALEKDIDTFGVLMPNATNQYRPSNGDTFVILHIDLPKAYIEAAEKRLEDKLIKYMYDNNFEKFNFSIAFSRIFFAENQNILDKLNENSQITIEYNGHEYSLYASSISITMSKEQPLPEIKVELNENISISQNQISQIVESTKKDILSKTTKDVFWGDIKGVPSWIGSEKPRYSYSELSGKVDAPSEFWKLKSTEDGEFYIHTTYPVVTQQGVTMYSDSENLDLPTIYDGLPIDNDTIYWEEIKDEEGNVIGKRIKARGGSGEGGITPTLLGDLTNVGSWANAVATEDRIMVQRKDSSSWTPLNLSEIGGGSADFSNVLSSGNGNAFTSFVLSEDKKTLTFVKGLTFAEKSDSLSGYGITDAYTKTEVDGLVEDYLPLEGGTIQGDVRLRTGNEYTSPYLYFGDGNEVYLVEETDSYLTIHADRDILLTTGSNYTAKLNGKSIATEAWVTNKGYATASDLDSRISALVNGAPAAYDTLKEIADVLQGNVNSIGDIVTALGGKADKATTLAGYGITDAKISNGVITLGGNTITPLTSHQTIYNLTLKAGTFSATTFDPNGEAKTVNIPTTTSHISEGDNLYFTNARAVSALSDTLKAYVTLSGTQTITGEKDFTGGLKVNGSQIVYDKTNKYWKLTGDLVVTGGITMFANDGTYTPSTITDAVNIDNQTIIRQNGKLMVNPELTFGGNGGGEVSTVAWGNIIGKPNTISGYGITDAKISNGVITLGSNTITPLTQTLGDSRYVTSLGTSGNDLTWVKDGTTNKITIPYSVKSKELSSWKVLTIKKNQDAGIIYKLIANLTNWKAGYDAQWGIIGVMYGHRGGNMSGTCIQNIVAYCASYSSSGGGTNFELKTDVTSYVKPYIVSYNGVKYLALRMAGSGSAREHCFLGYTENLLDEFIEVSESSVSILHETEVMSMGGVQANSSSKLATARMVWGQSFDGTDDVSGDMTGVGSLTMDGQLSLNGITIKKSASGVLFVDGNLVVSGGVTMYGTDGTTSTTIWDNAPIASTSVKGIASFDPNYFAVNNGKVTFIGSTGGGVADSVAWTNITGKPNTISGYGITDAKISNGVITLGGNTITPLTQTLGDARYVTALGTSGNDLTWTKNGNTNKITVPYATHSAHTSYLRNYLGDYNSITDLNEPSTFKTSQYRIVYDFYDGNTANRPVTSNNASGVLTLFKGIHRTGGGQYMSQMAFPDKDAVYLRRASDGVFGEWKQIAFTDSDIIGNAATATALKNPKTLWGQSFDGTENVSGDMTGVGSLTMDGQLSLNGITIKKSASGVLFVDGNLVVSGGVTMYGTDGTTSTTIWDNAPIASTSAKGIASFDPNYFAVNNGKVTFIGQTGGGIESITKQMVIDALGYTPYSSANPSGYITGISKSDVTTALGFTPYDASNPNNYVTSSGTVANATNLTSYKAVTFTKSDNGGKPCYMLIADVTSWYSASASVYEWGIAGIMYGWRGGNLSGTCVQKMIAMCSYNKSDYELKSDVITYVKPRIVSYGGKYYIALYMAGSGRSHYFIGKTSRLLDTFIEVACDSNGNCDGLAVVFDAETMSMNGASVGKLTTKRKIWGQDFDGSADVSGSITGATTGSFSGNVSMASATINGGKLTYNSTDKYWKLEGDLLVTGGVTMFGSDSSFNPSTITQAVNVDGTTIINDGTKLMLNPNIELGGGSVTDYNDLTGKPDLSVYALKTSLSSYQTKITSTNKLSYSLIDGIPTSLKNPNSLSWSGYTSGSYDGSSAGTIVIPSNTNQLTNGAGFITSSGSITGNAATATTASKLSIVSKTAWGQTYWTSGGIPTSISGDMTGVGTINSAITINSGDDSAFIKGSGHKMYFGGSGYANQSYYFRPLYGASGATATNLYIQNASAASSPTFTTTHSFLSTGNATHSGTLTVGKSITSGGSVLPSVGGSHSIGSSSNLWKDMWASNVKYTDSIYLGFTDSYIGFRVGGSGSQLIVDSTSVRTNSSASARASLGKYSVPWNGIYLGIDSSAANNKYGVNFSDASGYIVGRLGSSSSGLGMYSKGSLYLRGGCTSSSDSLTASKTGLVIDESGDVTISGNLLVSGGITMYATNNDNGFSGDFLPNEDVLYNLGSEEKRWKSLYSGNADFNDKIVLSGETGETCNITFQRSHSYVLFNGIGASSGSINFGTEATGKGTVMRIANSGRVGINTYQPEQALHVVGNIKCTGTLSQGSDIRYKEIHKELSISLATMADAPSIEYHFTDDESKSIHVGTSAQYWQSVNGVVNEGEDGRLGMDYSSLGVVMGISLAKELSRYESGTDKEIQTLKKRIGELEEEIENLKNK